MTTPDGGDLHDLLLELARALGGLHSAGAEDSDGVPMSQALALHVLDTRDGLTQQELAARLRLDKSTVSRLVAGLESRELLTRERDPANRRFVRLALTARGRRAHRGLAHVLHARQSVVLERMTAPERAALRTGLTALLRELHRTAAGAAGDPRAPRRPA